MKLNHTLALLTTAAALAFSAPSFAFKTAGSNPAAGDGSVVATTESQAGAIKLLKVMNSGGGAYGRDLYRNFFMQIMGLVFFDPNTPDIRACERDVLNYHLPELTKKNLDITVMKDDIARIMAQVYTGDEIAWLESFYSSPFGKRMLKKQLQFNERLTREIAGRYGKLKPEFQSMYGIVAERCGGIKPSTPTDAPKLGSELLSVPGIGAAPLPPSPNIAP